MKLLPTRERPGSSPLLRRYLEGDSALEARLGGSPRDPANLRAAVDRVLAQNRDRAGLADALDRTNRRLGAPAATLANIAALRNSACCVVITGQQPGILGGPLYTVHKAASVLAWSRHLSERLSIRFIPVFWVASDDHDLDEIERGAALDLNGQLHPHRVHLQPRGAPSSELLVPAAAPLLVRNVLLSGVHRPPPPAVHERFSPVAGERWPDWFGRILLGLFPDSGLVLFEPAQAAELVAPLLLPHVRQPGIATRAVAAGAAAVRALGAVAPLPEDAPSRLFVHADGRRRRYDPSASAPAALELELARRPGAASADAALRPVLQSQLFPAPMVVGGPGELAYWIQLRELFDDLAVPRPIWMPRHSATIAPPRYLARCEALGIAPESPFDGPALDLEPPPPRRGLELEAAVEPIDQLLSDAADRRPVLASRARRLAARVRREVRALLDDADRAPGAASAGRARRVRRLLAFLLPGGKPQERSAGCTTFLSLYGVGIFDAFWRHLDPIDLRHMLVVPDADSAVRSRP